jgi:hypothetical protein
MSKKDFQNGFAFGLSCGGIVEGEGITPINHTVMFTVDGEPYEIISVKNGNKVREPAVSPKSNNKILLGWQYADGTKQDFPFVPESNAELTALFVDGLPEIEINNTNAFLKTGDFGGHLYTKASSETAVAGMYSFQSAFFGPIVVSRTNEGARILRDGAEYGTTLTTTVNGETWYYCYDVGDYYYHTLLQNTVNLNKYLSSGQPAETAAQTLIKIYLMEIPLIN